MFLRFGTLCPAVGRPWDTLVAMPAIDVAMERSVRSGAWNLLAAAMQPGVKRDAITNLPGQITDVKTAFSSWDNCMQANFCKYVPQSPPLLPQRR